LVRFSQENDYSIGEEPIINGNDLKKYSKSGIHQHKSK
jgi:hypothetical protein